MLGLWFKIGIFNPGAPFLSDLSLILQAIIVVLLASAIYARLRHNSMSHGTLMGSGVALHTVSIFAIMVPSLRSMDGLLRSFTRFSLLTITHAAVGSLVEVLGLWLVASWLFSRVNVEKCFRRKNVMRITMVLWLIELVLGVYVYMMLYLGA
jgi:uncharacterized membrane protein YozB (DUF420 family)